MATSKREAFTRDRKRFLHLLDEIERRVGSEAEDHGIFFGVSDQIYEIVALQLPQRLGFQGVPFQYEQRKLGELERQHVIIWNDLAGGGGDIVTAHFLTGPGSRGLFAVPRENPEIQRKILSVVNRWKRAVDALVPPKLYPALVPPPRPGVKVELYRDPLWRKFDEAIEHLSHEEWLADTSWGVGTAPPWLRELETLVEYEEMGNGVFAALSVERGVQQGLCIYHPSGGPNLLLLLGDQGRLSRERLGDLRARLIEWREYRAIELGGRVPTPVDLHGGDLVRDTPATGPGSRITDPRFPNGEWIYLKAAAAKWDVPYATLHRWSKTMPASDRGEADPRGGIVLRRKAVEALVKKMRKRRQS